jgi:Chorismate mutase type II
MRRITLFSLLMLADPACYQAPVPTVVNKETPDRSFDTLLGLIRDRLDVMHDVARWKWAKKSSIEDPEREAALLKDVSEKGAILGLDPEMTRAIGDRSDLSAAGPGRGSMSKVTRRRSGHGRGGEIDLGQA